MPTAPKQSVKLAVGIRRDGISPRIRRCCVPKQGYSKRKLLAVIQGL